MLVGTIMAAITILVGEASVLYTFYAPLRAHPAFYIGLALVIIGSWIAAFVNFRQLYVWKKAHKGEKSPLTCIHGYYQYAYVVHSYNWRSNICSSAVHPLVTWLR